MAVGRAAPGGTEGGRGCLGMRKRYAIFFLSGIDLLVHFLTDTLMYNNDGNKLCIQTWTT